MDRWSAMPRQNARASAARRLVVVSVLTLGALVLAFVVPGAFFGTSGAGQADGYKKTYVATAKNTRATAQAGSQGADTIYLPDGSHIHPNGLVDDGHGHNHNDPATKNSVSRSAPTT